jgi:nicotinamidase-related amidase
VQSVGDNSSTALLVMDFQNIVVDRLDDLAVLDTAAAAIEAARASGVLVIYVRIDFRPGYPEVSPRNRSFAARIGAGGLDLAEASAATRLHSSLAPADDEPVVVKRRVSAFTGSDLAVILRSRSIDALVLSGIATSGVVLSTLREAADLDFDLTVLSDACADVDPEVHRVLTEKVFPRQAAVLTVAAWGEALS